MSKEIKKRVKDSEIEVAKSSNKKLFIITIIILLLIIVGLVLFLLYDYKIIFPLFYRIWLWLFIYIFY